MVPEIKQQWLTALRSGEFQQSKGCLKDGDGFCCLGVLCEIYVRDHPEAAYTETSGYLGRGDILPMPIMDWADLGSDDGTFLNSVYVNTAPCLSLAELNDAGMPFAEIADFIEEKF